MREGPTPDEGTADNMQAIAERLGGAIITLDRRNWELMFGNSMLGGMQYNSKRQFVRVQDRNTLGVHIYDAKTGEHLGVLPRY